jgi:hypothetical protein
VANYYYAGAACSTRHATSALTTTTTTTCVHGSRASIDSRWDTSATFPTTTISTYAFYITTTATTTAAKSC